MYREIQITKILNNAYLVGVVIYINCIYFLMLYLTFLAPYSSEFNTTVNILEVPLQVCFLLVFWSMIRAIISDPGSVPIYWGVLMDDQESKKRRYCLICHIFKPERCHHCSTCQRCVLNMDHHCPWIGNCVGYHNRKFFMLFLFYINITVVISCIILILRLIPIVRDIIEDFQIDLDYLITNWKMFATIILAIIVGVFGGVIFNFYLFHIELVSTNKTTIDTLEMKRTNMPTNHVNTFDLGFHQNFIQVMGTNKLLWFLPMFGESGRPAGDGVHWERNQQHLSLTEQNVTHRTQTNQNQQSQISQAQQR